VSCWVRDLCSRLFFSSYVCRPISGCWHQTALVVGIHWIQRQQHPVVCILVPLAFSLTLLKEFRPSGTKIHSLPQFDNSVVGTLVDDLEHRQQKSMATNAVLREFRNLLKKEGKYAGSKLELMDQYRTKHSSLASDPIYIVCWKPPVEPKNVAKKLKAPLADSSVLSAPRTKYHGANLTYGVAHSRTPRHSNPSQGK
jgi:hypothetical protein